MTYDIYTPSSPEMPRLGKGTECINLLLSQVSKDMREPLVPMIFPVLGAHICAAEFQYPDRKWRETCGMMANLVSESGGNKDQLTSLVEALTRSFRLHDAQSMKQISDWANQMKTRSANKEKPARPVAPLWFPPNDITRPAFIQNALDLEKTDAHTLYINMSEVEMANRLCGGHREATQMFRNIYDRQRVGALRATADGVTGYPLLRANLTISATPKEVRKFFRHELSNGTFGRVVFSFKPLLSRDGRIPRQGEYSDTFLSELDTYLQRLQECRGRYVISPLNKLVDRLAEDMCSLADQADDNDLWNLGKRAVLSAWKAGCILWVANNQTWTRAIAELVEWLVYHDMWSKLQIFGDLLTDETDPMLEASRRGPKNMLTLLPQNFNASEVENLRVKLGKSQAGTSGQLRKWVHRKFVTYNPATGIYTKTLNNVV